MMSLWSRQVDGYVVGDEQSWGVIKKRYGDASLVTCVNCLIGTALSSTSPDGSLEHGEGVAHEWLYYLGGNWGI